MGDFLVVPEDVAKLYNVLQNTATLTTIKDPQFGHEDFLFGLEAKQLVYDPIIQIMETVWHRLNIDQQQI